MEVTGLILLALAFGIGTEKLKYARVWNIFLEEAPGAVMSAGDSSSLGRRQDPAGASNPTGPTLIKSRLMVDFIVQSSMNIFF